MENNYPHFNLAAVQKQILAPQSGFISQIKTRTVGMAVAELGGGRNKVSDVIDHSVGFSEMLGLGEKVEKGQLLAMVHAQNENAANHAIEMIQQAYYISDSKVEPSSIIIESVK